MAARRQRETGDFFSPAQREILAAAAERLLPSDDGPGARETDAAGYVDRALLHPWNRHLRPLFEEGLEFLQSLAHKHLGKDFLACGAEERDEVLREAQVYPNNDARRFFDSLVDLVVEGFLCDPSHGGNRGGLGWRYVGYRSPEEAEVDTASCRPQLGDAT